MRATHGLYCALEISRILQQQMSSKIKHQRSAHSQSKKKLQYLMRMTFQVDGNATSERGKNSLKKRLKQDGAKIQHTRVSVGCLTFIKSY